MTANEYVRTVPIRIDRGDDKTTTVLVDVAVSSSDEAVRFFLTSAADVFLVFSLVLARTDFDALRERQALLVSFDGFKDMAKELLDFCIASPARFEARLCVSRTHEPSTLRIIETNQFRHITHLSLDFTAGNDHAVKTHLAGLVKQLREDNDELRRDLRDSNADLTAKLSDLRVEANAYKSDLDALKIAYAEQASRLELSHNRSLQKEKDDATRDKDLMRSDFERERREAERNHEDRIRSISSENLSLQTSHSQLQARLNSLEQSYATLQTKSQHLEQDWSATHQELTSVRQSNHQLSVQNSDWERSVAGLRARLESCEQLLQDRDSQLKSLESARVEDGGARGRLEEAVESLRIQNQGLEEGFRKASEEINKGNEIIRKIQTDLKSAKSKIKLKNVVTLQQEKLLDERASIIEMHEKELVALKQTLSKQESESQEYKSKIDALTKSVEEGKKIISENAHVIEWLHKQLNEEALNKPGVGNYGRIDFDKFGSNTATSQQNNHQTAAPVPPSQSNLHQAGSLLTGLRDMNINDQNQNKYAPIGVGAHGGGGSPTRSTTFKKTSPVRDTSSLNTFGAGGMAGKSLNATAAAASHLFKENLYGNNGNGRTGGDRGANNGYTKKSNYF
ncbi:UNVERIFIED_CONTAM: Spindle assembly abnormal protein 6 [Siphonaria sp. JEL0065]|nr:Spindle assembly abnormal protein 6 [Siphonaria sp. JEL0065]